MGEITVNLCTCVRECTVYYTNTHNESSKLLEAGDKNSINMRPYKCFV